MKYAIAIGATLLAIGAQPATAQMSQKPDQKFVREATMGGNAEVELGKMAADKAANPQVKAFGQRMADDHSKAGDELVSLANRKQISVSIEMDAKEKALRDRLMKLNGAAFDRAYMSAMVRDHEEDVRAFETESRSGNDPDVKAWAAKTLPTLQEHLRLAREADRAVGNTAQ
jgi:putative membrane protein